MFTESARIGCSFLACCGGLAKYQTCLIFHRTSLTLDPSCLVLYYNHLVWKHLPAYHCQVPRHHFPTGHRQKLTVLYGKSPGLWSQSWQYLSRTSREHTRASRKWKPTFYRPAACQLRDLCLYKESRFAQFIIGLWHLTDLTWQCLDKLLFFHILT